jgi:hypothetical protein
MNGSNGHPQICAICYYVRDGGDEPRPADVTINGQSVCLIHIDYVQGGSFGVALNLARAHQVGKARRNDD